MTPKLEAAYAEPHRRYHSRSHIERCLVLLEEVEGLDVAERRVLTWAIWWHDAVYDPRAHDNEARSAEMARADLAEMGVGEAEREEVARLIGLTVDHRVQPSDRLGAILVSIDLAILGGGPAEYDAYVRGVRQEYAHVPGPALNAGRAQALRRILEAPAIYPDPTFRARLEARARENMARELAGLG